MNNVFKNVIVKYFIREILFIIFFIIIFVSHFYSYLLFHTSVELFSIIIAVSIFIFAWNTRKISKNNYFLFLGSAYFFTGILDFFHTLSYKGMSIFSGIGTNVPTQLWIASRYLLAISILIAPVFFKRKMNEITMLMSYFLITILILLSVFYLHNFPESFREGAGLTAFKIESEYVISFLFIISAFLLSYFRDKFDKKVYILLSVSFILNIVAELLFTLYVGVYDIYNMLGHLAVLLSYYLIYKAVIEVGLTKPYNLLFLELKILDRKKDEFLSLVNHEVKNPLASIKLSSELLIRHLSKSGDTQSLEDLRVINNDVDIISHMISNLVDMNRIESGKLKYRITRFNFGKFIEEISPVIKTLVRNHKLIIKGKTDVNVKGDKDRIKQVIINFITNAVKYSPKDKKIILSIKTEDDEIILGVKDFGIGIEREKQIQIFDKYFRTERGERKAEGLGLGLYISKEIISFHKGKIWVDSEVNKGSTFYFTFPIR